MFSRLVLTWYGVGRNPAIFTYPRETFGQQQHGGRRAQHRAFATMAAALYDRGISPLSGRRNASPPGVEIALSHNPPFPSAIFAYAHTVEVHVRPAWGSLSRPGARCALPPDPKTLLCRDRAVRGHELPNSPSFLHVFPSRGAYHARGDGQHPNGNSAHGKRKRRESTRKSAMASRSRRART